VILRRYGNDPLKPTDLKCGITPAFNAAFISRREAITCPEVRSPAVSVYAGGGYYYPTDDVARLSDEVRRDV
jgi:hypothetical protein